MTDQLGVRVEPKRNGKGWAIFGASGNYMFIETPEELWEVCQVIADKIDELNGL